MLEHLKSEGHSGFLGNVATTLIDKTDGQDPKRTGNYWMRTVKIFALFRLNIEDSVSPIPCKNVTVTGGLTCLAFFLANWFDHERIYDKIFRIWHNFFCFCVFHIDYFLITVLICYFMKLIFTLRATFILYVTIVSIAWCKLLCCLLIYYSDFYLC